MAQLDGSWAEAHLDAVERHDLDCRQAHWAQRPVRQRGDLSRHLRQLAVRAFLFTASGSSFRARHRTLKSAGKNFLILRYRTGIEQSPGNRAWQRGGRLRVAVEQRGGMTWLTCKYVVRD